MWEEQRQPGVCVTCAQEHCLGYNETQAKSFPWRKALKHQGLAGSNMQQEGIHSLWQKTVQAKDPQNDKQFNENAIEVQPITGGNKQAKTMRILQDNELTPGLQNGKLEQLRSVGHPSEQFVEPWNNRFFFLGKQIWPPGIWKDVINTPLSSHWTPTFCELSQLTCPQKGEREIVQFFPPLKN